MSITLSPDQEKAAKQISDFLRTERKEITLGGAAGTGKSTLMGAISELGNAHVVAPTGKAAEVMRSKGFPEAQTIHSYIYDVKQDSWGNPVFSLKSDSRNGLLVVEESSMISEDLYTDLVAYHQGKIIFIGDHYQLPPVKKGFSLMEEPEIRLDQVHRQALDNPITRLADGARRGEYPSSSENIMNDDVGYSFNDPEVFSSMFDNAILTQKFLDHQILVYTNASRVCVNSKVRNNLGREASINPYEKMVVLQNNAEHSVFNGQLIWADSTGDLDIPINFDSLNGESYKYSRSKVAVDYGYALTVHKSQGSEWPHVLIKASSRQASSKGWLYTAITRAKKSAHVYIHP